MSADSDYDTRTAEEVERDERVIRSAASTAIYPLLLRELQELGLTQRAAEIGNDLLEGVAESTPERRANVLCAALRRDGILAYDDHFFAFLKRSVIYGDPAH